MQVRTELRRKLRSWRIEAEIACCGQWLGVLDSRVETLSIATVPERNRSSAAMLRVMPDGSPNPESSMIFQRQIQPTSPQPDDCLLHSPAVVEQDKALQHKDQDDTGQSSMAMQVSFLIHLQDPVELLPHVVNIDSNWVYSCIHCVFYDFMCLFVVNML